MARSAAAATAPPHRTPVHGTAGRPRRAQAAHRSAAAARPKPAARSAPAHRPRPDARPAPARRGASAPPRRDGAPPARAARIPLIDRLLRGRAWVVCVGALLAGIVFLNVSLLELNGGIARVDARAAALKRENAELRSRVAELGSSERIQQAALARGFALPAPGDVRYLKAREGADGRRAARLLASAAPDPAPPAVPAGHLAGGAAAAPGQPVSAAAPAGASGSFAAAAPAERGG